MGFKSTRQYNSYKDVDSRVEYVSEILDGGPMGPVFKVCTRWQLVSLAWSWTCLTGGHALAYGAALTPPSVFKFSLTCQNTENASCAFSSVHISCQ